MVVRGALAWVLIGAGIGCALLVPFEHLLAVAMANPRGANMASAMNVHLDASVLAIVLLAFVVLIVAALIASVVPARRAANVDPMVSLRNE